MAAVTLGSKAVGSLVKLKENGSPVNYLVVQQGKPSAMYDDSCDGTWLLRQDISENYQWNNINSNAFSKNTYIMLYLNAILNRYDTEIQNAIKQVKIPYCDGGGSNTIHSGENGLSCKLFLLGGFEVGWDHSVNAYIPVDGSKLSYFEDGTGTSANNKRIAYLNGSAAFWWMRSQGTDSTSVVLRVHSNGGYGTSNAIGSYGVRPALILPSTLYVLDDGSVVINQPPTAPASITVPAVAQGAQAAITWGAATDPDGAVASYTLERSINGSGWVQIYSGNALTYTDTIGDWGTVAYRVCAVDNSGVSGDYATSETITVQDGVFYISGPAPDMGEQIAPFDFTITTGISGDAQTVSGVTCTILLDGYSIHTDYTSTGDDTTVNIDVRAISSGAHTITAKADKAGYVSAVQQYTFTTPDIPFPTGGQAEQLQNQSGTPIFPQTTAALVQGLKSESIAGNIEELFSYAKIEVQVTAPAGSTVTATNGEIGLPGVLATNGLCSLILPQYGVWTITATLGGQTASTSITVNTVQQYEVSLSFTHIYGVIWDGTSSTVLARTNDAQDFVDPVPYVAGASEYGSPFDNLMPWAGMQRVSDPEAGELVKIPKFWYKWTGKGNIISLQIADGPVDGYHVSYAHCDRGDGAGERDTVYVGRYHCASNNRSVSGAAPRVNTTRSTFRTAIHEIGSDIWQWDWAANWSAKMLYLVEYANWNSQTAIGYGCGNNSAVQGTGYTDDMPYHTGTTQASRTTYGLGTQYRYIEGLWDNVYDWVDGCYYDSNGLNIILNPANFSDTTGGTPIGIPSSGYPTALGLSEVLGNQWIYPTAAGGSTDTYVPDYWYFGASNPCLIVGGYYGRGLNYGLFCVSCNTASYAYSSIGSRLMKLP